MLLSNVTQRPYKKLQRSNRYGDALSAPLGENNERVERKVAEFCTIIIEGVR
jgi:hypothetical protein